MSDEAKLFIMGLEECRPAKGMKWYGRIPSEVAELFDLTIEEVKMGYWIAGVYVQPTRRYEAFTPEWVEETE